MKSQLLGQKRRSGQNIIKKNSSCDNNSNYNSLTPNNLEIGNYECKNHGVVHKTFSKFCMTCNKNICSWCLGHNNHKTINFDSIEINEKQFESYEYNQQKMKLEKSKNQKKYLICEKYKKIINEFNDYIIKESKEINQNIIQNDSLMQFNDSLIKAYKEGKINYYILSNLKSLNFNFQNKDIYINYTKLNNYINNLIELQKNVDSNYGYKNMWISENYCKNWGFKQAIREFIQNQFDGIITKIQSKDNLVVKGKGENCKINGLNLYLNFDFMRKGENTKIYGEIRYDREKKTLLISNEGKLFLGHFLLGGEKEETNNPDIIGKFGEGMKLAILALCRMKKNITIISNNEKYSFIIKEDQLFIQNNKPQMCLHCKEEKIEDKNSENKILVRIENIFEKEWINEIDNYLWLLGDNIEIYTSIDKNNIELGQAILEKSLRNRIYVKGIFVKEFEKSENLSIPGINTNLILDRDRNYINYNEVKIIVANIIAKLINNNINYLNYQGDRNQKFKRNKYGFEEKKNIEKKEVKTNTKSESITTIITENEYEDEVESENESESESGSKNESLIKIEKKI